MKRHVIAIFVFLYFPLCGMESVLDVIVTTSNNKQYPLARWQTRESNTLYSLFLEELVNHPNTVPVCINVPTVSREELHAYSTAYHQTDFDTYFKHTLTAKQQRLLTIAAGEHARNEKNELIPKLHDVALSMKILSLMCDKDMFTEDLLPFFSPKYHHASPIRCMMNHFKRSAIIANARNGNFSSTTEKYFEKSASCINNTGNRYTTLPCSLIYQDEHGLSADFNGFTNSHCSSFPDGTVWKVDHRTQKDGLVFMVTPEFSYAEESDPTIKKVWLYDRNDQCTLLHEIKHINDIDAIVFSKDCTYLAVSSHGKNKEGKISLINLELEDNHNHLTKNNEISLKDYPGWNSALCFNNRSTHLVVGINDGIAFWDVRTGEMTNCFTLSHVIDSFCFNSDDSCLAVAYLYKNDNENDNDYLHYVIDLYDTTDSDSIVFLNSTELGVSRPLSIYFSSLSDALVIGTDDHALIINALTGEKIMYTEKVEYDYQAGVFSAVWPIFVPQIDLLATATTSSIPNKCNAQLWDVTSGELIAPLIKDVNDLAGIGMTPNCRSLVATYTDYTMTQIDLCDRTIYEVIDNLLKDLTLFQLYCLYRIDQENEQQHKNMMIHRQSFLYDGIKTIPQTVKDAMYNIFHQLKAYGLRFVSFKS